MADVHDRRSFIRRKFSENVGLSSDELFGENLSLAEVIARSGRIRNSVDLMEAFAKSSNAVRKEYGIRVRLPVLSLDTPISRVEELFIQECQPGREA